MILALARLFLAKPLLALCHALIWLLRACRAVLAWAWRNPWPAATAALALCCAWLVLHSLPARDAALAEERAISDDLLVMLAAEATAHQQTRRNYATAQLVAARAAQQQRAATELRYKELADHADARFQQGRAAALAAATRYAAGHRVPDSDAGTQTPARTLAGAGSGPPAPAPGGNPGGGGGPGGTAQLVAVTADDLRICTVNTQRLIEGRDWALSLNLTAPVQGN